jgi:hypothetical protein
MIKFFIWAYFWVIWAIICARIKAVLAGTAGEKGFLGCTAGGGVVLALAGPGGTGLGGLG